MAKQQIPLMVVKFQNGLLPGKPTQYRAAIATQSVITDDKLIDNISKHSGQPASAIRGVLAALPESLNDYLAAGNAVQMENFGTFKPKLNFKAVEKEEDCNARTLRRKSLKVYPTGSVKEMVSNFTFVMTDKIVEGEAEDEDSDNED